MGVKDGIEHIDTNIVIRLITRDDERMARKAEKLIAKKDKTYIFEDVAMMEVVFVLAGTSYNYSRADVAESIKALMQFDNIYFNKALIETALDLYVTHPKLSFTDCYLAAVTDLSQETPLWTFDHAITTKFPFAKEP